MLVKRFLGIIFGDSREYREEQKNTRVCRKAVGTVNFWEYAADRKSGVGNVITVA